MAAALEFLVAALAVFAASALLLHAIGPAAKAAAGRTADVEAKVAAERLAAYCNLAVLNWGSLTLNVTFDMRGFATAGRTIAFGSATARCFAPRIVLVGGTIQVGGEGRWFRGHSSH